MIFRILTLLAIGLIGLAYFSPIWWVSLKAPNYPPEAFPYGVRIHFHVDGVFNGCQARHSAEIEETETLDCVHEMDTINHYIGMYPIASGGVLEKTLSSFLFGYLIVLLCAFMLAGPKWQVGSLILGFTLLLTIGYVTLFTPGGVNWLSQGYQQSLQKNLEREASELKNWSGLQAMQASYRESLGRYFRDPTTIEAKVTTLTIATYVVIGLLITSMVILVIGILWQNQVFYWLLVIVPLLLPVFFVLEYAGWLWWFGHHLNAMGAFTIKPFMPTVFGDGKVAQFTTHSYPHYGFGVMVLSSLCLTGAALVRRRM